MHHDYALIFTVTIYIYVTRIRSIWPGLFKPDTLTVNNRQEPEVKKCHNQSAVFSYKFEVLTCFS